MVLADTLLIARLSNSWESSELQNIHVITGKGLGSGASGPVLKDQIPLLLKEVLGLQTTSVDGNSGRIQLSRSELQQWGESIECIDEVSRILLKPCEFWNASDCNEIDKRFAQ